MSAPTVPVYGAFGIIANDILLLAGEFELLGTTVLVGLSNINTVPSILEVMVKTAVWATITVTVVA